MSNEITTRSPYPSPIHVAIIGGTGLASLPGFKAVETLEINTPWGRPSSPITVLHHTRPGSEGAAPFPVAFLSRHGLHHEFSPSEVPVRANIAALRMLGVRCVIAFSAVGSLQEEIVPRDFVLPDQIIDRTKGVRPFTFFEGGMVGHVGMADPFSPQLAQVVAAAAVEGVLKASANSEGAQAGHEGRVPKLHTTGTLICMEGPQFSTRAESNLYRSWGGSVINMSALPEAKLAREAEMVYQMVCMATDYDCWRTAPGAADVDVAMVMAHMRANAENAKNLVAAILDALAQPGQKDVVEGKAFAGQTRFAGAMTAPPARGEEALKKLRWLFPGYFD